MSVSHSYDASTQTLSLRVRDRFNFDIYDEFRSNYRDYSCEQVKQIELDLASTDYMDSAALGMLLLLDEHFKHSPLHITNCSEFASNLLRIANFHRKFNISCIRD